ncbi:MAG: hypothetical protein ACLPH5_09600 [Candidatus Sulfotelmatobacter sp.]|jgi:hypothetical protein
MSDDLDSRKKRHEIYFAARQHVNSYYEKLALLDGATVSLVVTATLGKFLGVSRHKYIQYILGVALTSLVAAMLVLLYRNLLATRVEFPEAQLTNVPESAGKQRNVLWGIYPRIGHYERLGVVLSAIGIVLLLIEVWLVLANA